MKNNMRSGLRILMLSALWVGVAMPWHARGVNPPTGVTPNCEDKCDCPENNTSGNGAPGGSDYAGANAMDAASGYANVACLLVQMSLGKTSRTGQIAPDQLFIRYEQPDASLFSPVGLSYTPCARLLYVASTTNASGSPSKVTILHPSKEAIDFMVADNSSVGRPSGRYYNWKVRLQMVDTNGQAVVKNPTYYDITYHDGSRDRLGAAGANKGKLMGRYTQQGRITSLADSGIDLVTTSNNVLRQVKSPQCLADVVAYSDRPGYEVRFYVPSQVGDKSNDVYQASGAPFSTWKIEQPDPASIDKVRVTKQIGALTVVYDFTYTDYTKSWTMVAGGGLKQVTKSTLWDDRHIVRMDTQVVSDGAGKVARKAADVYQTFGWGLGMVTNVVDPDGAALKTVTTYYNTSSETGRYGKVATVVNPDGSWRKYDYDAQGRMTLELSSWKDATLGAASAGNARSRTFDYTPLDPADVPVFNDQRPRTEAESIAGAAVSRTFHIYKTIGDQAIEIEERSAPGAGFGGAGNQRTTRTYYPSSDSFRGGLLASAQYSDGRMDTYDYEAGSYSGGTTNPGVFTAGAGSFTRESVIHGTVASPQGIANLTTKDAVIKDSQGNTVLKETSVCTGGGYTRVGWTMQTFDEIGNLTAKLFSNGTQASSQWSGRTKLNDVDGRGIETVYGYDALGRVVTRTKKGAPAYGGHGMQDDLTTTLTLDAVDQSLAETVTAGGLTQATSRELDGAGRITKQTDTAGLVTTIAYVNDGRTTTVTQPGGATVITENYLDGRTKSVSGTGVIASFHDYGVAGDGTQWTAVYSGPGGANSPVWQRTTADAFGRAVRVEKPAFGGGTLTTVNTYNEKGRLVSAQTAPMPATRYVYDEVGNVTMSGLDVDGSGSLDAGGTDRVIGSATRFMQAESKWWQETTQVVYPVEGAGNGVTVSTRREDLGGSSCGCSAQEVVERDLRGNETRSTVDITPGAKLERRLVKYPDSPTSAVEVYYNGLLVSRTSKTGVTVSYANDALGRPVSQTQASAGGARTVSSTAHYDFRGWVDSVTDAAGHKTEYLFDEATGRRISVKDALQQTVNTDYDVMGRPTRVWGATYPVEYSYDNFGRMTTLKTFRQEGGAPDVTTWIYDQATGLLTRKLYADGNGPAYTYDSMGRLTQRTWARGVTATYGRDNLGQLTGVSYSDGTPAAAFTYDRLGRPTKAVTAGICTNTFVYDATTLALTSETVAGPDAALSATLTRSYDNFGRPAGLAAGPAYTVGYGYDAYGRFNSVSSSVQSVSSVATYSYLPGSDLLAQLMLDNGLQATRVYESSRDLITSVVNTFGNNPLSRFDYANDVLGRRVQRIDSGSATNIFGYNTRSELTSAAMGVNNYGYQYDAIGNRQTATLNGLVSTYTANLLNQYTQISDGNVITPTYDADGNMTSNGVWAYAWDAENRLLTAASNGVLVVQNVYDQQSRRIAKLTATATNAFLYDGWNLISEFQVSGLASQVSSYVWGLDLSGTLQGAGGVGGLLERVDGAGAAFCAYDANGNVTELLDSNGALKAHYEYDAFGNMTTMTGDGAAANPIRFSTKYFDVQTGLYYYGYRFYAPILGRWLSRDPIAENGGINLFAFVGNGCANTVDKLGLTNDLMGPGDTTYLRGPSGSVGPSEPFSDPIPSNIAKLGSAWDMFANLYLKKQNPSLAHLTPELQERAKHSPGVQHLKYMLKGSLKKLSSCNSSGNHTKSYNVDDHTFGIPTGSFRILTEGWAGAFQVKMLANCDWSCCEKNVDCFCPCTANCSLSFSFSKLYTFNITASGNQENKRLGIRILNAFAWATNLGNPEYRIYGGEWDENIEFEYEHECKSK